MSAFSALTLMICAAGIGVGMLSLLIPQKRTRRILTFVCGLFLLVSVTNGVKQALSEIDFQMPLIPEEEFSTEDSDAYLDAVVQETGDILVKALDELLRAEGIAADDIRLKLNISDEGRIYAERIDIYISEAYRNRKSDIRSLIVGNISKEPVIYVQGQEAE